MLVPGSHCSVNGPASCSAPNNICCKDACVQQKSADVNDLGVDDRKQVSLRAYPVSMFGAKKKCFNAAWYQKLDWLEYSDKFDAGFCFSCRNFGSKAGGDFRGMRCESTFTTIVI